jgi:hypothetical protein
MQMGVGVVVVVLLLFAAAARSNFHLISAFIKSSPIAAPFLLVDSGTFRIVW